MGGKEAKMKKGFFLPVILLLIAIYFFSKTTNSSAIKINNENKISLCVRKSSKYIEKYFGVNLNKIQRISKINSEYFFGTKKLFLAKDYYRPGGCRKNKDFNPAKDVYEHYQQMEKFIIVFRIILDDKNKITSIEEYTIHKK